MTPVVVFFALDIEHIFGTSNVADYSLPPASAPDFFKCEDISRITYVIHVLSIGYIVKCSKVSAHMNLHVHRLIHVFRQTHKVCVCVRVCVCVLSSAFQFRSSAP